MLLAQKAAEFQEDSHLLHMSESLAADTLGQFDEIATRSSILEDISKNKGNRVS